VDAALEEKVRVLLAKDEIRDVLMRYARGVDRGDADLIASCYHPDAVDDHGGIELTGTEAGPRFAGHRKVSASGAAGQHFMGNITIDVQGDVAYTESYFVSYLIVDRDSAEYTRFRGARYLDRFERRGGSWRIAYRVVVDDWDRLDKVTEPAPMRDMWRRGNIGELDPVATFRKGAIKDNEGTIREKLRDKLQAKEPVAR
jgi:ketosteroid isomerase-like protein